MRAGHEISPITHAMDNALNFVHIQESSPESSKFAQLAESTERLVIALLRSIRILFYHNSAGQARAKKAIT